MSSKIDSPLIVGPTTAGEILADPVDKGGAEVAVADGVAPMGSAVSGAGEVVLAKPVLTDVCDVGALDDVRAPCNSDDEVSAPVGVDRRATVAAAPS